MDFCIFFGVGNNAYSGAGDLIGPREENKAGVGGQWEVGGIHNMN